MLSAETNFIIHLKTSETYKTIKRSLPFCIFYFRAHLGSSYWFIGLFMRGGKGRLLGRDIYHPAFIWFFAGGTMKIFWYWTPSWTSFIYAWLIVKSAMSVKIAIVPGKARCGILFIWQKSSSSCRDPAVVETGIPAIGVRITSRLYINSMR